MILFAVCLLLPGWDWVGQTSRGPRATSRDIARGSRRAFKFTHIFTPQCVIAFAGANSRVKRAVPLGPTFSFRDVYTYESSNTANIGFDQKTKKT